MPTAVLYKIRPEVQSPESQNIRTGRPIEREAITNLHGIDALGGNSAISHG